MHRSWHSPTEKFEPFSSTFVSRPLTEMLTALSISTCKIILQSAKRKSCTQLDLTFSKALQMTSSLYSPKGSRFSRRVQANIVGSCGIMERCLLTLCNGSCNILIPLSRMDPSGSAKRKRAVISEDFPAPVLPATPICDTINKFETTNLFFYNIDINITFSFLSIVNEISLST